MSATQRLDAEISYIEEVKQTAHALDDHVKGNALLVNGDG